MVIARVRGRAGRNPMSRFKRLAVGAPCDRIGFVLTVAPIVVVAK